MKPRILMIINTEWYFLSHRLSLAKALQDQGCEVVIVAAVERGCQKVIEDEGFRFIPLRLQRKSIFLCKELATIWELIRLYKAEHPVLVHHITIKPVLYGSIAAITVGIPAVINTIPGLGYIFLGADWRSRFLRSVISVAYRIVLSGRHVRAIYQNPEDMGIFVANKLVPQERAVLIRGSGVNIHQFMPSVEPTGTPIILLASRLLWDKGVGELVDASRLLRQEGIECRVVIVGMPDFENPNAISNETLADWQSEGAIEWWGLRGDMPAVLKMVHIVALPTYYPEGVPKILLEASASGRPIVTTDVPGCREIVRHGVNGLLVPPHDVAALVDALRLLLHEPAIRRKMGARGRVIAETEFSEEQVIRETLIVYSELLNEKWPSMGRGQS